MSAKNIVEVMEGSCESCSISILNFKSVVVEMAILLINCWQSSWGHIPQCRGERVFALGLNSRHLLKGCHCGGEFISLFCTD